MKKEPCGKFLEDGFGMCRTCEFIPECHTQEGMFPNPEYSVRLRVKEFAIYVHLKPLLEAGERSLFSQPVTLSAKEWFLRWCAVPLPPAGLA